MPLQSCTTHPKDLVHRRRVVHELHKAQEGQPPTNLLILPIPKNRSEVHLPTLNLRRLSPDRRTWTRHLPLLLLPCFRQEDRKHGCRLWPWVFFEVRMR